MPNIDVKCHIVLQLLSGHTYTHTHTHTHRTDCSTWTTKVFGIKRFRMTFSSDHTEPELSYITPTLADSGYSSGVRCIRLFPASSFFLLSLLLSIIYWQYSLWGSVDRVHYLQHSACSESVGEPSGAARGRQRQSRRPRDYGRKSLRRRRRSARSRSDRSTTSRRPQNAARRRVSPSAAHSSAFRVNWFYFRSGNGTSN